ncbi:PREDICTED: uncharacterized protein LOC104783758 [Camelina sativa]|uniref:Uncharacterized protein LOC104783758 n=1 Tax=Camelina sativa TaxID=90675 RepID=A0ABM0YX17_CAMSA|nr:PREDICTED: uncharacterized protein LOC104783758 [Camelina sativa]
MHSCSRTTLSTGLKRKGTPRLVSSVLHEDYPGKFVTPAPKEIICLVQGKVGVHVSYSTAFREKRLAVSDVRGCLEESYGIFIFVHVKEGFQAMRKVIIVDSTFLKTKYGGALVFATAQDPAHHHYPIAFAVIDGEKEDSWTWFFNTLKTIIPDSKELRDEVAAKFREIAVIYTVAEFEVQYQDFRMSYPKAAAYLDEFAEVKKWAKCYFPGLKYNIDTSNVLESMNAVFKDARKYALLPMIDAIVKKFAEWFNKHRKEAVAGTYTQKLVPFVENLIHKRCEVACKLPVTELNTFQLEYIVIGRDGKTCVVDLRHKSCSCRYFDLDKYPCVHAIAAAMNLLQQEGRTAEVSDLYDLCTKYYLVELWILGYVRRIYLVPHKSEWTVPTDEQEFQEQGDMSSQDEGGSEDESDCVGSQDEGGSEDEGDGVDSQDEH